MSIQDLQWKTTKELIQLSEENAENMNEVDKTNLINELTQRLKRETQPKKGQSYGEFFANKFSDFVNNTICDTEGFVKQAMKDHNTLQQNSFRLFLKVIKGYSELPDWKVDGRNDYTNRTSKQIMEFLEGNTNCPYI